MEDGRKQRRQDPRRPADPASGELLRRCRISSELLGTGFLLVDGETGKLEEGGECSHCSGSERELCRSCHAAACAEASRYGEVFPGACPGGGKFLVCAPELPEEGRMLCVLAGPFRIGEGEEGLLPGDAELPVFSAGKVLAMKEYLALMFAGEASHPPLPESVRRERLETLGALAYLWETEPYPFEKERQLVRSIRLLDRREAFRLVNELLLSIYYSSGMNPGRLKMRLRDLLTLISRAAIDGGADAPSTLRLLDRMCLKIEASSDLNSLDEDAGEAFRSILTEVFRQGTGSGQPAVRKAVRYLQEHLSEHVTLGDAAAAAGFSEAYFGRLLKEETGRTFTDFLQNLRIERSCAYLENPGMSVAEIASACGFQDQSYFSRIFRQRTGRTPGEYRRLRENIKTRSVRDRNEKEDSGR